MNKIGIIANPASGKDIRRLVSHATVVDNNEKINIVKRIILGAQGCGAEEIYIMPDTFQIGYKAIDDLNNMKQLKCNINILNMRIKGNLLDTINAVKHMEELDADCIVILGGDGTNRAVAKSITNTPLIGVSTGTNNVYPQMMEGTIVGMAAAAISSGEIDINEVCRKDKRIEIFKNKEFIDIALIDSVISKGLFVGSKAIWNMEDIEKIIVTRSHPASIGFSSVVGCRMIIKEEYDFGAYIDLDGEDKIVAPIAAGTMEIINTSKPEILNLDEEYKFQPKDGGIIALDGEREVPFKKQDEIIFKITRNGPYRVDVNKTLELAQKNLFFNR